jgi:Fic family protein
MRTFEETHPWLRFAANLQEASPRLWIMLGECQSKCEHIARVPLRPETAEELYKVFLAKGVNATTAIEGNSLTEEQVREHLEGKLRLPPSQAYQQQEIDNIIQCCNRILESVTAGQPLPLAPATIHELNGTVLHELPVDEGVVPGEIRKHSVVVGRYRGAPAEDCDFLLERLCAWLNSDDFKSAEGLEIGYATLKAVIAHLYLAWIHPFGDGNGRTARLIEFQILISSGVPAPAAHLLSNHYNLTRQEYYRQLDLASRSGGDILPFVTYAIQGFLDGLKTQLDTIWQQQWDVAWRNYVHELFRDKSGPTHTRQRHLVLDLSLLPGPVPNDVIPEISLRMAQAYARKTRKTLSRDLNALQELKLIEKTADGYRARRELILGFLPPRVMEKS